MDKDKLVKNKVYLSPLSVHIYIYLYKKKMPDQNLLKIQELINFVPIDESITNKSMAGPTSDFEDNLQLHSAASFECDYFLTNDKHLLSLRFFGKTQIADSL